MKENQNERGNKVKDKRAFGLTRRVPCLQMEVTTVKASNTIKLDVKENTNWVEKSKADELQTVCRWENNFITLAKLIIILAH